ncbi:MAG: SBBP repeat-containing protein [bacterium]
MARYNSPGNDYDAARDIAVDATGNVYVTGRGADQYAFADFLTIKYSPDGQRMWVKRYNGPGDSYDEAYGLALDNAGNIYITGRSHDKNGWTGDYDYATIKYNGNGAEMWVARHSGPGNTQDYAEKIAVDASGNVFVAARSVGTGTQDDYLLVKFNNRGVVEWSQRYNGPGDFSDWVSDLKVDRAGNVYVTGSSEGVDTRRDFATIRYNTHGEQVWLARYNAPGNLPDEPYALGIDLYGNVYVAGSAYHTSSGTNTDFTTVKYNAEGVQQWVARYNNPADLRDEITGFAIDRHGNIFVTGYSYNVQFRQHITTIKYNTDGTEQWVRVVYGGEDEIYSAQDIAIDYTGNVYVTGSTRFSGDNPKILTLKYNSSGEQQWIKRTVTEGLWYSSASEIIADKSGAIYVVGSGYTQETGSDFFIIKYSRDGEILWTERYSEHASDNFRPRRMQLDAAGNVYIGGANNSLLNLAGFSIVKYDSDGNQRWVFEDNTSNLADFALDVSGNIFIASAKFGIFWQSMTATKYLRKTESLNLPSTAELAQNYPNPFNSATVIRYGLPSTAHVSLKVYNLLGQEVATLADSEHIAGWHEVTWGGENVPSGVYIYRLQSNKATKSQKLALVK